MPGLREGCPRSGLARRDETKTAERLGPRRRVMNATAWRLCLFRVPIGVDRREVLPFFREIVERENRGHRADGHARSAINAFHWVDIKLGLGFIPRFILPRMNTIHRAYIHTCRVFRSDAGLSNYIGHLVALLERFRRSNRPTGDWGSANEALRYNTKTFEAQDGPVMRSALELLQYTLVSGLAVTRNVTRKSLGDKLTKHSHAGACRNTDTKVDEDQTGSPILMRIVEVGKES
jgi:hypothetical protein